MKKKVQQLTKAEEEVMQILWGLEKAFVKDVIEQFDEPRPAYNTVSTIIRILEKKGFVSYKAYGRTHQYFPTISKEEYLQYSTSSLVEKYFSGSYEGLLSFFVKENKVDAEELEKILNELNKKK